jgi:hypothetical protein
MRPRTGFKAMKRLALCSRRKKPEATFLKACSRSLRGVRPGLSEAACLKEATDAIGGSEGSGRQPGKMNQRRPRKIGAG